MLPLNYLIFISFGLMAFNSVEIVPMISTISRRLENTRRLETKEERTKLLNMSFDFGFYGAIYSVQNQTALVYF